MKLLFPNGEHAAVELSEGISRVGSGSQSHVVLVAPGVSENHCEIEVRNGKTTVRVRDQGVATVLNGRQIASESPLKAGDLLLFGRIGCRVVASERDVTPVAPTPAAAVSEEDGRTRVRMALPKFMLRGVSGATFGRNFALVGTMTIGRQSDCGIPIPAEEISRHHARLQVTADGVMVEDLGSANGTWINDKRVHTGMLNPGDELRLDTVRFLLLAPGMQAPAAANAVPVQEEAAPASQSGSAVGWIIGVALVAVVLVVGALKFFGVF